MSYSMQADGCKLIFFKKKPYKSSKSLHSYLNVLEVQHRKMTKYQVTDRGWIDYYFPASE